MKYDHVDRHFFGWFDLAEERFPDRAEKFPVFTTTEFGCKIIELIGRVEPAGAENDEKSRTFPVNFPVSRELDNRRPPREPNGLPHGQKSTDIKGVSKARFTDPAWG